MRGVRLFFAALPALTLVAGLVSELPERIAIHWGFFGVPDGSAPRGIAFAVAVAVVAGLSLCALVRSRSEEHVSELVTLSFVAALCTGVWAGICFANHGQVSWEEAALSLWTGLGFITTACLASWAVARVVRRPETTGSKPSIGLQEGQTGVFFTQIASPLMGALAILLLGLSALVLLNASSFLALFLSVLAVLLLMFARVSLSIDRVGLSITYGLFAFPRQTIPMSEIVSAEAIIVRPLAYGGWGYRGSLHVFGKAALVLRAGVAIKLLLANGKTFVVTVDNAESGAGLINDLVRNSSTLESRDSAGTTQLG